MLQSPHKRVLSRCLQGGIPGNAKSRHNLLRDLLGPPRPGIHKYPVRFPLRQHSFISHEPITPQRPHLSPIRHPRQHRDLVIHERRFQILDPVHPNEPRPAQLPRQSLSTTRLRMPNRRVLYPLNIRDVVDMPIRIHHFSSHSELQTKHRVHFEALRYSNHTRNLTNIFYVDDDATASRLLCELATLLATGKQG